MIFLKAYLVTDSDFIRSSNINNVDLHEYEELRLFLGLNFFVCAVLDSFDNVKCALWGYERICCDELSDKIILK